MAQITLNEFMQSGGGQWAFVYHIAGMPWAATNSPSFKSWLDAGSADALAIRKALFGNVTNETPTANSYSAYDVQLVTTLKHDLGSQRIKYDERKGLDVGGWSVRINTGETGYNWDLDSNITHVRGLLGLDFQPTPSTSGVVTGVISRDFQPSSSTLKSDLYWFVDRDNGLKSRIEAHLSANSDCYLWVGSSCLSVTGTSVSTTLDQNEYYIECKSKQFRTPQELVLNKVIGSEQMIQVSNVPFGMTGYTGNLWGIPFDFDAGTYIGESAPNPILWRTGKVLTNPAESGQEVFTIKHSGFTQQLDYKVSPDNSFEGHITGYTFNRMETTRNTYYNDYNEMQQPHIWIWEFNKSTSTMKGGEFWCNDMAELGYKRFDTLDEVKNDCVTQIDGSDGTNTFIYQASPSPTSLDLTYTLSDDGDLVWDKGALTDDYYVFMHGPVGWVCGFGYVEILDLPKILFDQTDNKLAPFYSRPRAKIRSGVSYPGVQQSRFKIETIYRSENWSKSDYWLALREKGDDDLTSLARILPGEQVSESNWIKNLSTHSYYFQSDWQYVGIGDGAEYVPKDTAGNRYVYIESDGDSIAIETNDRLTFGNSIGATGNIRATVESVASDGESIVVDGEDYSGTTVEDRISQLRYSMHWAKGWEVLQGQGVADFDEDVISFADPYLITDNQAPTADDPVDLLKQLLGSSTIDVGVPRRSRLTTVSDLLGNDGEKTLIDWDALSDLVSKSGLDGVSYGLDLNLNVLTEEERESTENQTGKKISIKEAFVNLCLTHGIRMIWEYNETQRSWWLSFKPFSGDSVASASNSGRSIDDNDVRPIAPSAVIGGDWIYSNLDVKMRNQSGGMDTFKVDNAVGKNQHNTGAKTLSINDTLTIIPVGASDAKDQIIQRVANYLEIYSKEHYVQKYKSTIRPLALYSVGTGIDYTSATATNRETGARGITNGYAELLGMTVNLGPSADVAIELRTSVQEKLGIAPSLYVSSASRSGSVVTITGLATSASNNDFADPDGGLTDLATFDCYYYNKSDGTVRVKDCSCGDYAVWMFERNSEGLVYDAGTPTNNTVWSGTIGTVNLGAGSAQITLDDTTNFDTVNSANGEFVVIFADRDSSDLQSCQLIYGWLGDSNGQCQDSSANDHAAITWI